MSDPPASERLVDIAERAKCIVLDSVKPATRISHDSYWNKFAAFCVGNALRDPSEVTAEAPNRVAYCINTRFEGGAKAGSCDNIRSAIRSHCKRFVKHPYGWVFDNHLREHVGKPCDAIEVMELIRHIFNTSHSRGDTAKRAAPMTISMICQS